MPCVSVSKLIENDRWCYRCKLEAIINQLIHHNNQIFKHFINNLCVGAYRNSRCRSTTTLQFPTTQDPNTIQSTPQPNPNQPSFSPTCPSSVLSPSPSNPSSPLPPQRPSSPLLKARLQHPLPSASNPSLPTHPAQLIPHISNCSSTLRRSRFCLSVRRM